jgi:hypothetical protein
LRCACSARGRAKGEVDQPFPVPPQWKPEALKGATKLSHVSENQISETVTSGA